MSYFVTFIMRLKFRHSFDIFLLHTTLILRQDNVIHYLFVYTQSVLFLRESTFYNRQYRFIIFHSDGFYLSTKSRISVKSYTLYSKAIKIPDFYQIIIIAVKLQSVRSARAVKRMFRK